MWKIIRLHIPLHRNLRFYCEYLECGYSVIETHTSLKAQHVAIWIQASFVSIPRGFRISKRGTLIPCYEIINSPGTSEKEIGRKAVWKQCAQRYIFQWFAWLKDVTRKKTELLIYQTRALQ